MVSNKSIIQHFGLPADNVSNMIMWTVPEELRFPPIPKKIYCHRLLVPLLTRAFRLIISRSLQHEFKTWDGCYNDRVMRGYEQKYDELFKTSPLDAAERFKSIHSWGLAIDINAFENQLGHKPAMSPELVKCFTDVGFDWGGNFHTRLDGMHFQVSDEALKAA